MKEIFMISVAITLQSGLIIKRNIDVEESFVSDLNLAIRNGKDPINALALLADIGSRNLDSDPLAVKNRIGDLTTTKIKIEAAEISGFDPIYVEGIEELNVKVTDIYNNPKNYYDCGDSNTFYAFTKFLWIKYPDGSVKRLVGYAIDELGLES